MYKYIASAKLRHGMSVGSIFCYQFPHPSVHVNFPDLTFQGRLELNRVTLLTATAPPPVVLFNHSLTKSLSKRSGSIQNYGAFK